MDLFAMEPDIYIPTEAGSTEIWSTYTNLFPWAVYRYTIQPNGLLLPFYSNSNEFTYILQGQSLIGLKSPGCFEESDGEKNECQNIKRFQSGDVSTFRSGDILWSYNDGNETVILITVNPITNGGGLQEFFLGGPSSILHGFSLKFLSKAFNINVEFAMKLQTNNVMGNAIYASDGFHLLCSRQDQLDLKDYFNIVEESFCNINTRIMKISDPSKADLLIPEVGYIKTIDARQLPVLKSVQLSATYHFLLKDVMRLPHWENSHSITYVVKGEGRIQVVNENGMNVFDGVVKGGQLLIIPKNFVMAELAKSKIFEYIIFKTNAYSITSDLTGQNSVISDLPLSVIINAYNITEEEAKKVKFGRKDISLAKIMSKYI